MPSEIYPGVQFNTGDFDTTQGLAHAVAGLADHYFEGAKFAEQMKQAHLEREQKERALLEEYARPKDIEMKNANAEPAPAIPSTGNAMDLESGMQQFQREQQQAQARGVIDMAKGAGASGVSFKVKNGQQATEPGLPDLGQAAADSQAGTIRAAEGSDPGLPAMLHKDSIKELQAWARDDQRAFTNAVREDAGLDDSEIQRFLKTGDAGPLGNQKLLSAGRIKGLPGTKTREFAMGKLEAKKQADQDAIAFKWAKLDKELAQKGADMTTRNTLRLKTINLMEAQYDANVALMKRINLAGSNADKAAAQQQLDESLNAQMDALYSIGGDVHAGPEFLPLARSAYLSALSAKAEQEQPGLGAAITDFAINLGNGITATTSPKKKPATGPSRANDVAQARSIVKRDPSKKAEVLKRLRTRYKDLKDSEVE